MADPVRVVVSGASPGGSEEEPESRNLYYGLLADWAEILYRLECAPGASIEALWP